ncbi:MAG: hypothetical protein ABIK86_06800, partial [candidate division WOR-3 bacterium]
LASPSRCIDAGTSTNTPEFDFEGEARYDDPNSPNRGSGSLLYYDVGWDEYVGTGMEETTQLESRMTNATIVRGKLNLQSAVCNLKSKMALLDATGRSVLDLLPGPNDLRQLAPGVYFVRHASSVSKVFVTK